MSVHAACLGALLLLLAVLPAAGDELSQCATAAMKRAKPIAEDVRPKARFDEPAAAWRFAFGDDSHADLPGEEAFTGQMANRLRNRRLLFVGDSTARNPAVTLIALLCNPARYASCRQVLSGTQSDGPETALPCTNSSREFSMSPRDIAGDCEQKVKIFAVPLKNVTADHVPTREERRHFWLTGQLAPMMRMIYPSLNLTIDVASAGCSHRDGMDHVLDKLLSAKGSSLESEQDTKQIFGTPYQGDVSLDPGVHSDRPYLSKFDAVVLAGGLHCKVKNWVGGYWYRQLAASTLPLVAAHAPVVWTEISFCLKYASRQSPTNLISCNGAAKHALAIEDTFVSVPGVYIAPTRTITRKIALSSLHGTGPATAEERRHVPCLFVDNVHPSLHCYAPIAATILETIDRAVTDYAGLRRSHPECVGANGRVPRSAFFAPEGTREGLSSPPPVPTTEAGSLDQSVPTTASAPNEDGGSAPPLPRTVVPRRTVPGATPPAPSPNSDGLALPQRQASRDAELHTAQARGPSTPDGSVPWWAFFCSGIVVGVTLQSLMVRRAAVAAVSAGPH